MLERRLDKLTYYLPYVYVHLNRWVELWLAKDKYVNQGSPRNFVDNPSAVHDSTKDASPNGFPKAPIQKLLLAWKYELSKWASTEA